MLVLGLESSCDETAAAVVEDGRIVRADIVASQHDVHAKYGGVVPELASRAHVSNIVPVLRAALDRAGVDLAAIDGIAVTAGPGLVGALLIGLQTGKAIAWVTGAPLVGVHHLEGHLSAIYLEPDPPPMPHLALIVSGGHTSLAAVFGHGQVMVLGKTRDDAAGEAFDKAAKLLGLGYPGGAVIDRLARTGDPRAIEFPRLMTARDTASNFSFSGLKTFLLHHVRAHGIPEGQALADLCASYQAAIVEVLVRKTRRAARRLDLHHVQVCGGVAANSGLRAALVAAGAEDDFTVHAPSPARCTDNAAMIAVAGYHRLIRGERAGLELNASASLPWPDISDQPDAFHGTVNAILFATQFTPDPAAAADHAATLLRAGRLFARDGGDARALIAAALASDATLTREIPQPRTEAETRALLGLIDARLAAVES